MCPKTHSDQDFFLPAETGLKLATKQPQKPSRKINKCNNPPKGPIKQSKYKKVRRGGKVTVKITSLIVW